LKRTDAVPLAVAVAVCVVSVACGAAPTPPFDSSPTPTPSLALDAPPLAAEVVEVGVSGADDAYQFNVTVSSPDTGCDAFADWWEVVTLAGDLVYRRVLLHSHVDEQPFTRNGGPVAITSDQTIIVRAHMNTTGYGTRALRGSVAHGLHQVVLEPGFAAEAATLAPLPDGCAF
jgi:hypothetical protein